MSQKAKNITLVIILLIVIYIIYNIVRKLKPKANFIDNSKNNSSSDCDYYEATRQLKYNDTGCEVKVLQKRLNYAFKENISEDGILGDETLSLLTRKGYSLPLTADDIEEYY